MNQLSPRATQAPTDFVGRQPELAALMAGLEQARGGRGSLFLVGGEPGIGKTRLADEFAIRAGDAGARVLWGRCWEDAGAPPYWPWVQVLRGWLRSVAPAEAHEQLGTGAADVAQLLPEIRALVPGLPPAPPDSPAARFQMFDSATTLLRNMARVQVTALALDDLHAADIPSVRLLRFVASQLADIRLVVLATYRDLELTPDHPLTSALQEVSRESVSRMVRLGGLPEDSVAALLASVLGTAPATRVARDLWRETGGNPLFMGEAVRLLAAEGRFEGVAASGTLRLTVPPGLREVIARRLRKLPSAVVEVLTVGAALGPEFSMEMLRRAGEYPAADLAVLLEQASRAGVLVGEAGTVGRLRFSHGLVREVLYQEISPVARAGLHHRIAAAIEELHAGSLDAHVAQLAHHYFEAVTLGPADEAAEPGVTSLERARTYARQAGELAARSLAYEEASRHFRMALHLEDLAPEDGAARIGLLLQLGDADARAGDLDGSRRTFLHAGALARRNGDARQLATAALGYGGRFVWVRAGRDRQLVPLLQDALVLLGGRDDPLRVRLLARLACAWRDSPQHREHSAALSEEAVDLARRLGDPSTLGYALTGRFWATWWPDNTRQRMQVAEELLAVALSAGDAERIIDARLALFVSHAELTRMVEARAELDAVGRLAEELRQPAQVWLGAANQIVLALMAGDFRRAEALIRSETEQMYPATPIRDDVSSARMHRFLLHRELGSPEVMESAMRASAEEFPWYPFHRSALACLLIDLGRDEEARLVLAGLARKEFEALYRDSLWLMGICLASEACARLGDKPNAQTLYGQVAPFAGGHAIGQGDGSLGAVDRYLGLLAQTMGRLGDAERHLRSAIALNERMGARPWTAHSQHDLAVVLRARGEDGDEALAAQFDRAALETAQALEMTALIERIGPSVRTEGSMVPAAPAGCRFRREGEYWTIAFGPDEFRLRDAKGLQYLARLLGEPGREILAIELAQTGRPRASRHVEAGLRMTDLGDAGAHLDDQAKQAYRRRLHALQEELDEAESWNDPERSGRAREEMGMLARELSRAVGLGGRDRVSGSANERARLSVTRAIRLSMARIAEHSAGLGDHLEATIRTGTYCSYRPDPRVPVDWSA
ncbi:MAG TPA: AAA family ATPase [Candidatus Angelobacter sp.]|nr:AAA family ATPase [Candidatus Angelobacter sp.]